MVRFIQLYVLLVVLITLPVNAHEHRSALQDSLEHGYVGIHGMVLFNKGTTLYASHLPLYRKPHNAQIIYQIETQYSPLVNLVKSAEMVTIKPELFNLQRLIRGEAMSINVDVYNGHFERGGSLNFENIEITLGKQVYLRMLKDFPLASLKKQYDIVALDNGSSLVIHQIQIAPSFDHILMMSGRGSCEHTIDIKTFESDERH
ncbi:MAG: hypothetical protein ABJK37_04240 [Paraglaciecola sp.]|uniref:hypothetical protein n=1 Tax=Paraglaciecola sp. TaxID=1920173 RepID=UPI0032982A1F